MPKYPPRPKRDLPNREVADVLLVFPHHRLIRGGEAVPFTAHASPPTVTMPRVKAMTTGSVPSFVDAILNFAEGDESSSMAGQDTWLAQVRAGRGGRGGGRLVMFGDDTWLKLFPDMFVRADGTSSFFVSVSAGVAVCRMELSASPDRISPRWIET